MKKYLPALAALALTGPAAVGAFHLLRTLFDQITATKGGAVLINTISTNVVKV